MGESELSPQIERLMKRLEKDPSSKVFAQLGDLYRKAKLYDEAIKVLTKGLDISPDYAPGHLILAKTYLDQVRPAMAKEELNKVIEYDPQNLVALRLISDIVEKSHDDQEKIRIYEMILSVDPSDSAVKNKLDELKKRQPKRGEAKEDVSPGEFKVDTFRQFQPSEDTKDEEEKTPDVSTNLVDQMDVEQLDKKPSFKSDLPEEKLEVEPYVESPGKDIESKEEETGKEEELEIERDVSFQPREDVPKEKIETDMMGQLTGGKKIEGEEVKEEEIDLKSDLMSQMGVEEKKSKGPKPEKKIDTDMIEEVAPAQPKPEPTPSPEPPQAEKKEEVSSIEDILDVKSPDEQVPTVDEIVEPEEKKPEQKIPERKKDLEEPKAETPQKEEPKAEKKKEEKKENLDSFRDWLEGLSK